jgi:hypothetical protein
LLAIKKQQKKLVSAMSSNPDSQFRKEAPKRGPNSSNSLGKAPTPPPLKKNQIKIVTRALVDFAEINQKIWSCPFILEHFDVHPHLIQQK